MRVSYPPPRSCRGVPVALVLLTMLLIGGFPAIGQRPKAQRRNPPALPSNDRSSRPIRAGIAPLPRDGAGPSASLGSSSWTAIGPASLNSGSGLVSGRVTGIAVDPTDSNTIFVAAAGGGVWKTTDGGTTWSPLTDSQSTLAMGAIAVAPTDHLKIYAATGEANNSLDSNRGKGILVSNDGGASWTLEDASGAFDGVVIGQIAVDPSNENVAYAAVGGYGENGLLFANTGIWKTTDGGTTWTNTTSALDSEHPWSAVVVDPNTPAIIYAAIGDFSNSGLDNGVYRSTDGGTTWTQLTNAANGATDANVGRIALGVSPAANTTGQHVLYVAVADVSSGGLHSFARSDHADAATPTFTDLTSGTPDFLGGENGSGQGWYDIAVNVDATGTVYCAGVEDYSNSGADNVIYSSNLGVSWTDISTVGGIEPHTDSHAIAFDTSNRMFLGTDGGIFRYNPAGPSWTILNADLNTIQFQGIGLHPTATGTVVGGSQDNGTELYSDNLVWLEVEGGDGGSAQIAPTDGTRCYDIHPVESFGIDFFRHSDSSCASWYSISAGLSGSNTDFYPPFAVDPVNEDHLLLGTDYVNESTDGGNTWLAIGSPNINGYNPNDATVDSVAVSPANGKNSQVLYAAVGGDFAIASQIFVTRNDTPAGSTNATWTEVDIPACNQNANAGIGCRVNQIVTDPNDPTGKTAIAVTSNFSAPGNSHVFRTVNAGTTWADITGNLPNEPVWSVQVDIDPAQTMYVAAEDGVYVSASPYGGWSSYAGSLPHAQALDLELNRSLHLLGVATHGRGAWEVFTPPYVANVTTTAANGTYVPGAVIPIVLTFSAPVTAASGIGVPDLTLVLNTTPSATATYSSGSGTNALTFLYTVGAGQTTSGNSTGGKLDYASGGALSLNGGVIEDASGTSAESILYAPGGSGSLSANNNIVIAAKGTPTVAVRPGTASVTSVQSLGVAVTVAEGSGNPTPTGSVTLTSGSYTSAASALSNGSAMFTVPAGELSIGSDTLSVNYTPDTAGAAIYNNASGTSSAVVVGKGAPAVVVTPASVNVTTVQTVAVTVMVGTGTGNPIATGSVTLSGGGYSSAAISLSGGGATFNVPAVVLGVGSKTLTAVYVPDTAGGAIYLGGTGTSSAITVTKGTPTVTVTPASSTITTVQSLSVTVAVIGGSGNPVPTGSVILASGSYASAATVLIAGSATISIPAETLAAGSDSLTATYTPDSASASIYAGATGTAAGSVTVSKVTPSIALTSSVNPSGAAQSTTLTATLTTPVGTPTGTVMFYDGTTLVGSGALSGGVASYATASLDVGSHSITAQYAGDSIFASVTSTVLTQTVSGFSIGPATGSPTTVTAAPGGIGTYLLTVIPPGYNPVTLAVTGLPSGFVAAFTPNTVPAAAGATDLTLTINVPAQTASARAPAQLGRNGRLPVVLGLLLLPLLGLRGIRKRRFLLLALLAISQLMAATGLNGCSHGFNSGSNSGGNPTPPGTYDLTVTATAGSQTRTMALTLIID